MGNGGEFDTVVRAEALSDKLLEANMAITAWLREHSLLQGPKVRQCLRTAEEIGRLRRMLEQPPR